MDVGDLSKTTFEAFAVDVTITRGVLDPRDEVGVLHLDGEAWETRSGMTVLSHADAIDFFHDVDVQKGDVITCSDPTAVPEETTWEITGRDPEGDDGWLRTWSMKKRST